MHRTRSRYKPLSFRHLCILATIGLVAGVAGSVFAEEAYQRNRQQDERAQQNQTDHQRQDHNQQRSRAEQPDSASRSNMSLRSAADLIGLDIVNPKGKEVGEIEDVVIDPRDRTVAYVVLGVGGFMDVGEDFFAVPLNQLDYVPGQEEGKINVDLNQIEKRKGFDRWPTRADESWQHREQTGGTSSPADQQKADRQHEGHRDRPTGKSHSQQQSKDDRDELTNAERAARHSTMGQHTAATYPPPKELDDERLNRQSERTSQKQRSERGRIQDHPEADDAMSARNLTRDKEGQRDSRYIDEDGLWMHRVSHLIGTNIVDERNDSVGELENLLFNPQTGKIQYAVISYEFMDRAHLALVPAQTLQLRVDQEEIQFGAPVSALTDARVDGDRQWDQLSGQEEWIAQVDRQFEQHKSYDSWLTDEQTMSADSRSRRDWRAHSDYSREFNADEMVTITGDVISVGSAKTGDQPFDREVRLRVRTDEGMTWTVHTAPQQYLQSEDIDVKRGNEVTVKGSKTKIHGRSVILATELHFGNRELDLRDAQGQPQWSMDARRRMSHVND